MPKRPHSRICSADGCEAPPRTKGLCSKHYKQFLRHGRLTPEKEQRSGCRIHGCFNHHKARGYCAKHYKELMAHGGISDNGKIADPFCAVSNCESDPARKGLCEEHYEYYVNLYIENGYTWEQVDRAIVLHNQLLLRKRNRLALIRDCHRNILKDLEEESESQILADIMEDEDDLFVLDEPDDDILDDLWSEAEADESCDLWKEELWDLR